MKLVYKSYEATIGKKLKELTDKEKKQLLEDLISQIDEEKIITRVEEKDEEGNYTSKYRIRFYDIEE
jgi:mRNA-degrading endonuclease RelE of RelBE toxin-antitoxin system